MFRKSILSLFIILLFSFMFSGLSAFANSNSNQDDIEQLRAKLEKIKESHTQRLEELEKLITKIEAKIACLV